MAQPWSLLTISYSLFLIILYAMVNTISTFYWNPYQCHRHIRMTLHGDVPKLGYYQTRLYIGKPAQEFTVIVDTGSNMTWVPCSEYRGNQNSRFKGELSNTYVPCNGTRCKDDITYGEGSSVTVLLGEDIISLDKEQSHQLRAVFGCATDATGAIRSQSADGIMGLGRGEFSIVDQFVRNGVISDSFSLCFGGMDFDGGYMILGGICPPADMVFSPSNHGRSDKYNVELKDIHIAGKPLDLNPTIFDEGQGTIMDSGTTFSFLPEQAFFAFKNAISNIMEEMKIQPIEDVENEDICFPGAEREAFPAVDLEFSNGQRLSLSPENYLFRHENASYSYCLGIYQSTRDTTILGAIMARNTLVTYDRGNDRIGFWKTNCSDIWEWERLSFDGSMPSKQISTGSCISQCQSDRHSSSYSTQLGNAAAAAASSSPIANDHDDEL